MNSTLTGSFPQPNAGPSLADVVTQQKGFLLGQLTVLGHAADQILGNFSGDVPVLSDDAKVGLEEKIENLFPASAQGWIKALVMTAEPAIDQGEKQLDATIVGAILLGKANLDAAVKSLGT